MNGLNDNPEEGLHPQIKAALLAMDNRVKALEDENNEARLRIDNLNKEIRILRQAKAFDQFNSSNDSTNCTPSTETSSPRAIVYNNSRDDEEHTAGLSEDTFSLMKINPIMSMSWFYSIVVYGIQSALLVMIFSEQLSSSENSTPFDVPFTVDVTVRVGQILAIVVTVVLSQDVLMPFKELSILWVTNPRKWTLVTGGDGNWSKWVVRILLPNLMQLVIGALALIVSFVIIIQSEDVIGLLADFAAMSIIAELDNVAFWFAEHGYAGDAVRKDTETVKEIELSHLNRKLIGRLNVRPLIFFVLLTIMLGAFAPIIRGQSNGDFFHLKYPNCAIKSAAQIESVSDGSCDGGYINRYECGFDGGDCNEFNQAYPTCDATTPEEVGDGECQMIYNTEECGYDGGDCCSLKGEFIYGDSICHAGILNTARCLYDSGDCDEQHKAYPSCPDFEEIVTDKEGYPIEIGNGICNQGKENLKAYMNKECGYVFGDCLDKAEREDEMRTKYPHCDGVEELFRIGDGVCDGGAYLSEACGFDEFDCCELDHSKIGDKKCDGDKQELYLRSECGYEALDCCDYIDKAGNDFCGDEIYDFSSGIFLSKEDVTFNAKCAWDRGDCEVPGYPDCRVDVPSRIGDGICNGGGYNVVECGYDGGDCSQVNEMYPNCQTTMPFKLGDGLCEQSSDLNTEECGWDGGDCIIFNAKYPNCETTQAYKVGDGYCNTRNNIESCGYDGGDCNGESTSEFRLNYPFCEAEDPIKVGDGICQNRYNTIECGWDGGDCFKINMILKPIYPDCVVGFPGLLGDGNCQGGEYNTEECGNDLGDCDEFNFLYPDCDVAFPAQVGDGNCFYEYNTLECGWDGGDCLNRL